MKIYFELIDKPHTQVAPVSKPKNFRFRLLKIQQKYCLQLFPLFSVVSLHFPDESKCNIKKRSSSMAILWNNKNLLGGAKQPSKLATQIIVTSQYVFFHGNKNIKATNKSDVIPGTKTLAVEVW